MVCVICAACGESFEAKTMRAKYCSGTCRTRGNRGVNAADVPSDLVERVTSELTRIQKLNTVSGQQALLVARRLVSPATSSSAVAGLSADLSRLMDRVGRGTEAADPVDQLRERRDHKAREASS